jgi:hypothetical protein
MAQARIIPGNAGRDDYPRMLYHPDGNTIVVATPGEHDKLAREGWEQVPLAIHQRRPVTHSPTASGADPLAVLLRDVLEAVLDERGIGKPKGAG